HLHGDGPAGWTFYFFQRDDLGDADGERDVQLHGDGDGLVREHGHGELLGDGESAADGDVRVDRCGPGGGDRAGDDGGQWGHGRSLHVHGDGPAGWTFYFFQRDDLGDADG